MRKLGKKRLARLMLPALLCMLLAACSKQPTTPTPAPTDAVTTAPAPSAEATHVPSEEPTAEPTPETTPEPVILQWTTLHKEDASEDPPAYQFSADVPQFGLEEIDSYFESKAANLYTGFLEELEEDDFDADVTRTFELTCSVPYNKNGIVSVVFERYTYFGGAYPGIAYDFDTIDTTQGTRLQLVEVLKDPGFSRLKKLLADYFPIEDAVSPEELSEMIGESFSEEAFSLDETSLHCYFPDYAFGIRGWTDIAVPYEALQEAGLLAGWVTE